MSSISLIQLPYDSGRFGERMGRGPIALIESGLVEHLRSLGNEVDVASVRLSEGLHSEANALAGLPEALKQLSTHTVYVHLDLDVIDASEGRANGWACGCGLSLNQLRDALELIGRSASIVAGAVTCYDPAADMDGRIGRAIPRIVELLAH